MVWQARSLILANPYADRYARKRTVAPIIEMLTYDELKFLTVRTFDSAFGCEVMND